MSAGVCLLVLLVCSKRPQKFPMIVYSSFWSAVNNTGHHSGHCLPVLLVCSKQGTSAVVCFESGSRMSLLGQSRAPVKQSYAQVQIQIFSQPEILGNLPIDQAAKGPFWEISQLPSFSKRFQAPQVHLWEARNTPRFKHKIYRKNAVSPLCARQRQ